MNNPIEMALAATSEIQISLMSAQHPSSENLHKGLEAANRLQEFLLSLRGLEKVEKGSFYTGAQVVEAYQRGKREGQTHVA